jgi:hypothetical protein
MSERVARAFERVLADRYPGTQWSVEVERDHGECQTDDDEKSPQDEEAS